MAYITQQQEVWQLSGELLMDNANAVLSESAILPMENQLTIDFSNITNIDTSALALMIEWMRRAKLEFCLVNFTHVPDNLKSLALLYGVDQILNVQ